MYSSDMDEAELKKLEMRFRKAGFDPDVTLPPKAAPEDLPEYSRLVKLVKSAKVEAERIKNAKMLEEIDEYRDSLKRVAKARAIQRQLNTLEKSTMGLLTPWPPLPKLPPPRLD